MEQSLSRYEGDIASMVGLPAAMFVRGLNRETHIVPPYVACIQSEPFSSSQKLISPDKKDKDFDSDSENKQV